MCDGNNKQRINKKLFLIKTNTDWVVKRGLRWELFYLVHVFLNGLNGFLKAEREPNITIVEIEI